MLLDKGLIDQIRYVAYVPGMAGKKADRWGLSHLESPKSQPTLELKSSQVGVPKCFFIRFLKIRLDVAYVHGVARNNAEPCR